jgi:hypothetical protein
MSKAVHTVVIPGRHPSVVLSQELQVGISAVLLFLLVTSRVPI